MRLERLRVDRNRFLELLRGRGIGCSVHWRPLHLHPYYEESFGWKPGHLPEASRQWTRLISLPLFPGMTRPEQEYIVNTVHELCLEHAA